ncbi:MAG: PIN domain-containing protein [Thermodesulfovibrionales bacterium]|nr:PIN domain-containing protein [Thermodesulfovibrionales bacterium]
MRQYIISHKYLPVFYNPLLRGGQPLTIDIKTPAFGEITLCKFTIDRDGVCLHDFISQKRYNTILETISNRLHKKNYIEEIPEYQSIHESLFMSGIIKPIGLDELYDYINSATKQSVVKGGDVYYIAFDTNALMDCIYTNHLRQFADFPNIDFILCETVRFELTNRRGKIKRDTCNDLTPILKDNAFDLLNQNYLADRRRYAGFLEYNKIRHETDCEQLKPIISNDNKDEEIIRTYAHFATEKHSRKVLLISRDNEFIRMSPSLPDVIPISISRPGMVEGKKPIICEFASFHSFLYHLSVSFCCLELCLNEHRLFKYLGVWSQKNTSQWENQFVKIEPNKALPFLDDIDKQLSVLESMKFRREHWRFPQTDL